MQKAKVRKVSITPDLTEEKRKQLCALLGNVELSLLYKASVHGYQASAFHQKCDNQGPTLIVAYNRSGYIFGGYTSVDYAQSGQQITDEEALLFSFHGKIPTCIKVNSGYNARYDDAGGPNFGQQLYFCYNNQPAVYSQERNEYCHKGMSTMMTNKAFSFSPATLYGNDTQLTECEVYKVEDDPHVSAEEKPWRKVLWTANRRAELMEIIRNHKPLMTSVSPVRILMIGPVGAGKSSFFNSINSIFTGHVTNKAMSGSAGTSLTVQFRTYPVNDGREGKPLPFVLCDTMGLEEQSGAGLDIEDISSILQGHVPDRYKIVLMTKVDEACPLVEEDLQSLYVSSYIKTKVQEVSSWLGVPVSCVLPVKNYSQELELELNCDVLLLTALQQILRFADDYFDDIRSVEGNPK
ncbi:hypothetical protein cypCar_00048101 [Cyprinus carpio]|nr:hypothetical protein cypCar_00048101 [Cyprinus carpio]